MIEPDRISGRLGNKMFEMAFMYAHSRNNNLPLVDDALGYYYQSSEHFKGYEEEVKRLFRGDIELSPYIAIHVRRGDYVGHHFYVDLTNTDYYVEAMKEFPHETFMVFSDDIEWCKK